MVSVAPAVIAVHERLLLLPNAAGYWGDVPSTPPTISPDDPRVLPYWVYHPGAGAPGDERSSGDQAGVDWQFQVTAVAGVAEHLPALVDAINNQVVGFRPVPGGSRVRKVPGYDPGPPRQDRSETPVRFVLPLLFVVHI